MEKMNVLSGVSVGEFVYVRGRYNHDIYLFKVDEVGETHLKSGERKFRISDGCLVGTKGWSTLWASPATHEIIYEVKLQNIKKKILKFCMSEEFSKLTLESLEMILSVLPIGKEEKVK